MEQVKRESQILSSLNRLENVINEIEKAMQGLVTRLEPVLNPGTISPLISDSKSAKSAKPAESKASLALRIDQSTEKCNRIVELLADATRGLEI